VGRTRSSGLQRRTGARAIGRRRPFHRAHPDKVAPKTAWTAVELDPITGRIAKALYGGAEVNVQGYET
jgi:hypothetical protein